MIRPLLAASLVLAIVSAPLSAQGTVRSNPKGLMLGLGMAIQSIESDELFEDSHGGMGLDFVAGWGFTNKFAVLLDLAAIALEDDEGDDAGLGHLDLAARYSFANPARAFVPYLEAGFTVRALVLDIETRGSETGELAISGSGFSFGGGVQYFMTPKLALNANLKWTNGEFSDIEFRNVTVSGFEYDATTTRFVLGVAWYPLSNRTP